jgi:ATP-binding cassette subfamily B protein
VGVAGADVLATRVERLVLPDLAGLGGDAVLASASGRVIASNTVRFLPGDIAPAGEPVEASAGPLPWRVLVVPAPGPPARPRSRDAAPAVVPELFVSLLRDGEVVWPIVVRPGVSALAAGGSRISGRQSWRLLWASSKPLSVGVLAWAALDTFDGPFVVGALGFVVGAIPAAVRDGMGSRAGGRLIAALVVAGLLYAASLILDPIGSALGTAASQRITGRLQARLLSAVTAPVTVAHLEDAGTLDRLASAEGSLTGFFPGDAPVTWVGSVAGRLSGVFGCAVIAAYFWWLGLLLLAMWVAVRQVILKSVLKQAVDMRGQTTEMRRAWYYTGVGSKARDAKEVRVFGLAAFFGMRYARHFTESIRAGHAGLRGLHRRAAACFLVVTGGYALAIWTIADAARTHGISTRSMAIMLPMLAITAAAGNVSMDDITLAWTLSGLPDADRLERDLRPPSELDGTGDPGDAPQAAVAFEAVRFRYPTGPADVLAGVDLELAAGTSTALVGVNGAGKSTLVSLLARLRDPTGGRVTVDGVDVRTLEPGAWQRMIALMPQDPVRYPLTAYDNVAFGALEHAGDREGVQRAAELAGFAAVVDELPKKWDTVLSRQLPDGAELSGGQWQRLALARALFATFHGARILVLDEPTAALDVRAEARFYQHFHEITAGLTTLVISHRFATVRRAQRIYVLDGGVITESGGHDDLVKAGGSYAEMYRVQAARFAR